jgi:predicted Zn-dependent protease
MTRSIAFAFGLCLACGSALGQPSPFRSLADVGGIDEYEQRVWSSGEEFDRLIAKTDLLDDNPELVGYLQAVLDRLFPHLKGTMRVRVIKSPMLNAFALPNGSIYMNQGLLARFDNEAQLAAVLAHEGSHFTHRHSFRMQERAKTLSLIHLATNMLRIPYPWARDLLLQSSMFGYSREMETEADSAGFERLKQAGYDLHESPKVFAHLLQELRLSDIKEPFFFATHPKLQDRIDNYSSLIKNEPAGGTVLRQDYARLMESTRLANLDADLELHRPMSVLAELDFGARTHDYPPRVYYYLGEAYRMRAQPWDEELAEAAYLRSLKEAPSFTPPHYGLGVIYLKRGALEEARKHFQALLSNPAKNPQRAFAEQYIKQIEEKLAVASK